MVQSILSATALDCFGYKGCRCEVKRLRFFSSSSGIDVTIKKSIVKQYRTIEQLGKAFLGCACWPGGWGAL